MFMTVLWYCAFYFVTYVIIEVLAILWRTPYLQATDAENVCSVCFALYLLAHQLVELVVVVLVSERRNDGRRRAEVLRNNGLIEAEAMRDRR